MNTQFVWTKKFNRILACFYDEVPVNANQRHYFRSFPNSFSGRSALDTMEKVLTEVFPDTDIQRNNAQKVLELFLRDGIIISLHKNQIKDDKDSFYRFANPFSDKYGSRPRRSVSMNNQSKRFAQPRVSTISPDHFNSEPEICAPSTSSDTCDTSILNSMESVNKVKQKSNCVEVDAAAWRFLQWISQDAVLSEQQRRKTVKAFKAHYPDVYRNFMFHSCKSPSTVSAPNCVNAYIHQNTIEQNKPIPLSPATSHHSVQSDLTQSISELSQKRDTTTGPSKRQITSRLSDTDLNMQLLRKLDSVIDNPIYSKSDRHRILKYFKHVYPAVYSQRFNLERPLLKKIREFLPKPKISGEVR